MKNIQVLGPGCAKCRKLAEHVEQAAKALGIEYKLEKITDLRDIVNLGVMATPALIVDGEVKAMGRVPLLEELREMLAD